MGPITKGAATVLVHLHTAAVAIWGKRYSTWTYVSYHMPSTRVTVKESRAVNEAAVACHVQLRCATHATHVVLRWACLADFTAAGSPAAAAYSVPSYRATQVAYLGS
jgi:hypothetical protein